MVRGCNLANTGIDRKEIREPDGRTQSNRTLAPIVKTRQCAIHPSVNSLLMESHLESSMPDSVVRLSNVDEAREGVSSLLSPGLDQLGQRVDLLGTPSTWTEAALFVDEDVILLAPL